MALTKNDPSTPLTVGGNVPFSWLRTVTVTPGMTACWESTTFPRRSPVPCWALTVAAIAINTKTAATVILLIDYSSMGEHAEITRVIVRRARAGPRTVAVREFKGICVSRAPSRELRTALDRENEQIC